MGKNFQEAKCTSLLLVKCDCLSSLVTHSTHLAASSCEDCTCLYFMFVSPDRSTAASLTLGGCNYSITLLADIHWGRARTVKPLQVSLKQLSPHCPHQRATFTIFRMEKENRNCIVRAHSTAAFTRRRSIAKMTRISFLPVICAAF